jgi:hypothetical protein
VFDIPQKVEFDGKSFQIPKMNIVASVSISITVG